MRCLETLPPVSLPPLCDNISGGKKHVCGVWTLLQDFGSKTLVLELLILPQGKDLTFLYGYGPWGLYTNITRGIWKKETRHQNTIANHVETDLIQVWRHKQGWSQAVSRPWQNINTVLTCVCNESQSRSSSRSFCLPVDSVLLRQCYFLLSSLTQWSGYNISHEFSVLHNNQRDIYYLLNWWQEFHIL